MKKLLFIFMILCSCPAFSQGIIFSVPGLNTTAPSDSDCLAILHFEGGLSDVCGFTTWHINSPIPGHPSIATTSFYGGNPAKFGLYGIDDVLQYSPPEGWTITASSPSVFNFGAGDFTVEFWIQLFYVANGAPNSSYQYFGFMSDDYLVLLNIFLGANPQFTQSAELSAYDGTEYKLFLRKAITAGNWFHVCFERQGGALRGYINGVYCGTSSGTLGTRDINPTSVKFVRFERNSLISELFIDEIRISKTARYKVGSNNFTPPSAPFGKMTGGKLVFKPALSGKNNRIEITGAQ